MITENKPDAIRAILEEGEFAELFNKSAFANLISPEGHSNPRLYLNRRLRESTSYEFTEEEARQLSSTLLKLAEAIQQKLK